MPRDAHKEISRHLDSGESLKWAGVPRQGLLLRASDIYVVPFSLMWGGSAIYWEVGVIASGAPFFFMLFGIPFVLVGLYFTVGRFFVDARQRARTFYGLTDRRAVIVSGLISQSVNSIMLKSLSDVTLEEKRDRSGTITFGRPNPMASWMAGVHWPGLGQYQPPVFEMIPEAKAVYDYVLGAQRTAG